MEEATLATLIVILLVRGSLTICPFDDPTLSIEEKAACIRAWINRFHQNVNDEDIKVLFNGARSEEDSPFESDMTSKRGKLDQNFLRFGRFPSDSSASGKRTQLDRNFLRFGRSTDHVLMKRNAEEDSAPTQLLFSPPESTEGERQKKNSPKIRLPKSLLNPAHLNLIRELSWKRGALERNFLRFGRSDSTGHHLEKRSNLERNFLRFGRNRSNEGMVNENGKGTYEKENEWQNLNKPTNQEKASANEVSENEITDNDFERIQQKKASLDRNFLRFGRTSEDECFDGSDSNCLAAIEDHKRSSLNKNFLRFGKRLAEDDKRAPLDRNFLRFGRQRLEKEKREPFLSSFPMDIKRAPLDRNFLRFGRDPFEREGYDDAEKRNSLNKNFLRFGRTSGLEEATWRMDVEENKRAPALDRNFLRFGKRSVDNIKDNEVSDKDLLP